MTSSGLPARLLLAPDGGGSEGLRRRRRCEWPTVLPPWDYPAPRKREFPGAGLMPEVTRQSVPAAALAHDASASWFLPQTHLGGGSSRSVPQERSQGLIAPWLTEGP